MGADAAGRPAGAGADGGWLSPTVLAGDLGDEVARLKREQEGTILASPSAAHSSGMRINRTQALVPGFSLAAWVSLLVTPDV